MNLTVVQTMKVQYIDDWMSTLHCNHHAHMNSADTNTDWHPSFVVTSCVVEDILQYLDSIGRHLAHGAWVEHMTCVDTPDDLLVVFVGVVATVENVHALHRHYHLTKQHWYHGSIDVVLLLGWICCGATCEIDWDQYFFVFALSMVDSLLVLVVAWQPQLDQVEQKVVLVQSVFGRLTQMTFLALPLENKVDEHWMQLVLYSIDQNFSHQEQEQQWWQVAVGFAWMQLLQQHSMIAFEE